MCGKVLSLGLNGQRTELGLLIPWSVCRYCGTRYVDVGGSARCECWDKPACARCGGPREWKKHYCGSCWLDASLEKLREHRLTPEYRAAKWQQKQVKRALKAGVHIEDVDPRAVYERDHWLCHICGYPIDRDAHPSTSRAASIDHVIPISRGGVHAMNNVKAAHFGCNSRKSNHLSIPAGVYPL